MEIGSGISEKAPQILIRNGFPKDILLVADNNTLKASKGLAEKLIEGGFTLQYKIYENLKIAAMEDAEDIARLSESVKGILSVGTGSLNDICRLASYKKNKPLAIFATAPSMDGFASDTSPIITNNFKLTLQAHQPEIIIADTQILADSPSELKGAGFGDMVGKYIGLVDWRVSNLVTGEYYCEKIADLTREAVKRIVKLTDKVKSKDENTAGIGYGTLVLTGIAMKLAACSRPASGTEHILSHFWEVKKLERNQLSDYHGRKVGVATVLINKIYKDIAKIDNVEPIKENPDWDNIYKIYGEKLSIDVKKLNSPTITETISPQKLKDSWQGIRQIINEELSETETLIKVMKSAGAPTTIEEIHVDRQLAENGLIHHSYMSHRVSLMRLLPMLNIDIKKYINF